MEIKEIICPFCRKNLMYLHYEQLPGFAQKVPSKWICNNCVITYQHGWFGRFHQYEFLVLRKGGNLKKWLKNLKVNKKVMSIMKLKMIRKNGRQIN